MAIDNDALIAAIDAARENAYGSDEQSALGQRRAKAIEYYLGLNTNPAPQGRSQVVDRSVYETIQVKLPSLVRIFAGSSDQVCKAVPIGPDDEQAADQLTAVLNHVVTDQNPWEQIIADWAHDALLLSNGYCLGYWDESKRLMRERYEGQSDDQLAALLSDTNIKVLEHSEEIDEQSTQEALRAYQQAMQQYQMMAMQAQQAAQMGQQVPPLPPPPQEPQPVVLHDVVIERVENEGHVCIKVLPPEHCRVSADTPDWTLNDCSFFEYREQKTIADLRAMGLDVPEDISDDEDETDEDHARDRFGEDRELDARLGVMRKVWASMVWIKGDFEGDEESRMYYSIVVGRTPLYTEPVSRIMVASMTAQPLPHRHVGMSEAEVIYDIQDIRTVVTRGALDNLYLANNGRNAVSSKVNLADFLDSRPGGVVRMVDDSLPAEGHIMPLVHPFAFDQIVGSLEYFDQIRQNRTGANRYFSGTDAGAINKTASGTMALQNMSAMRVEHQARMMAPAVEDLFDIVQELISKHANKAMTIKLRGGKWQTVDPQAWRTKRDIRISVGVGAGNKESMMAQLGATFGAQMQTLPLGLAGPQEIHATVTEMSKLSGFSNPDKFWKDPTKNPPPPQQPPPEIVKEQMKQQGDMQKLQAEQQADAQKFQAEKMLEKFKAELESIERERDRELQKAIAEMQEATKLTIARMQQENAQQLEVFRAQTSMQSEQANRDHELQTKEREESKDKEDVMGMVQEAMQAFAQQLEGRVTMKAEKVRDANGKVIGARITHADGSTREVQIQ